MKEFCLLSYYKISIIYFLYNALFYHLSYSANVNISNLHEKLKFLSGKADLNFRNDNNSPNNICAKNIEISELLKAKNNDKNKQYICLYHKTIFLLKNYKIILTMKDGLILIHFYLMKNIMI